MPIEKEHRHERFLDQVSYKYWTIKNTVRPKHRCHHESRKCML